MKPLILAASTICLLFAPLASAQFTSWSGPVNLGPPLNTAYVETCVTISKNGLSLYFASNRPGGVGGFDLYVATRASVDDAWGAPQLVPNVNSSVQETCPALSLDEHRLFFASARPGGVGGLDLYVSRRHNRKDDLGWQPPVNLGSTLNSPYLDGTPVLFEDEAGRVTMYFGSNRPGGLGGTDIYMARMKDDDTFEPPVLVGELSSPQDDSGPAVRRNGLEVIIFSTRPGGAGGNDLWGATRNSTSEPWSAPANLIGLNSSSYDGGKMSFSFDGRQIYFRSDRPGGYGFGDLYVATRDKLRY